MSLPRLSLRRSPEVRAYARPWYRAKMADSEAAPAAQVLATEALSHVDALYAFAWRLARNAAQAEDLVQETFVRALASAGQFAPGTRLKAWLFRILRNVFIDQCRRAGRLETYDADDDSTQLAAPSEPLRGDHELERLRKIVATDIDAALRALPEPQRSVVLLDLEGFSEAEMAEVLDCAAGTIKSRLARARAALRVQLKEYAR